MRFVLHKHFTDPEHFDLMLDTGGHLETWRLPPESIEKLKKSELTECEKINNHRREYLDYEGPISRDRGRVETHDSGELLITGREDKTVYCDLKGSLLNGSYIIGEHYIRRAQ